jgi:hypothetical protein
MRGGDTSGDLGRLVGGIANDGQTRLPLVVLCGHQRTFRPGGLPGLADQAGRDADSSPPATHV